jgi:hypothetical protein
MNDGPTGVDRSALRPTSSSGRTFFGLLVLTLLAAVLLGQLTGQDPSRLPSVAVAPRTGALGPTAALGPFSVPDLATSPDFGTSPDFTRNPRRDPPIGVESLQPCQVRVGGLVLGDPRLVPGWSLERWDCDAPKGPWSLVIRRTGQHLGVAGAVVTFPVGRPRTGQLVTRPQGARWDPALRRLVWPLAGSYAQIVGGQGVAGLADLAMGVTLGAGRPQLESVKIPKTLKGFAATATIPYGSTVVHEMRYRASDLGQESTFGDGNIYTGVLSGASFESEAYQVRTTPAGLVRGRPAIYVEVPGGHGTLAWEPVPGEVMYIGFSAAQTKQARANFVEALRALADHGKALTANQWLTKDQQVGSTAASNTASTR